MIVGDIDGDGRDEIVYGSMVVDENGKGIYSTGYGHGDSQHLADINPDIPGLEHFACLEGANGSSIPGALLRNAATGKKQWSLTASGDIGRCLNADIDENNKGYEFWTSEDSGIYNSKGTKISTTQPTTAGNGNTYNFAVWWDGDVMRELLDRTVITKWNATNQGTDRVATLYNITDVAENNGTKANPCLMADFLGDWREEIIYRNSTNTEMTVFVTPQSTSQRMYTLMHDPNYRTAISWQQNSYNQPPNLGFYFGVGMDTPPAPNITVNDYTTTINNPHKADSFKLQRAKDQLYYNVTGSNNQIVFYEINGQMIRRQILASNQGALALDELAPNPGLYIAIIEQNGVAKFRLLIEKTR